MPEIVDRRHALADSHVSLVAGQAKRLVCAVEIAGDAAEHYGVVAEAVALQLFILNIAQGMKNMAPGGVEERVAAGCGLVNNEPSH